MDRFHLDVITEYLTVVVDSCVLLEKLPIIYPLTGYAP